MDQRQAEGRSKRWRKLKKRIARETRERAGVFVDNAKESLTGPDASRNFFKHVQNYSCREKPPRFEVRDLFQGETDLTVADKVAEHLPSVLSSGGSGRKTSPPLWTLTFPAYHLMKSQNNLGR